MIVVDASIFIDLIFEYNSERTHSAEELFSILEKNGLQIVEPDLFKIELTGQISRRMKKDTASKVCDEIFQKLAFIDTYRTFDKALSIALKTGSRAADSFYIATAIVEEAILISNDRFQIGSSKKSGIEVYNLLENKELIKKRVLETK
ncbi:MAG: type II toxin-antitoxin system VapC family toxin [Methanotrichaceae archaeon]